MNRPPDDRPPTRSASGAAFGHPPEPIIRSPLPQSTKLCNPPHLPILA